MSKTKMSDHMHILNTQRQKTSAHQGGMRSSESEEPEWAEWQCMAMVQDAVRKRGDAEFIPGMLFKRSS